MKALGLALLIASLGFAESQRVQYSGTLGGTRIGLTVNVDNGRPTGGHYFYYKYLTDIPLEAAPAPNGLTLKESGATFQLHFKGNGSEAGKPLDFTNSVGLTGAWTGAKGSRTLPVTLNMQTVLPGGSGPRYADVTKEGDAAFEKRAQAFYRAVLDNNRQEAARYVSFPLRVNGKHPRTLKTPQAFIAAWDSIFTPAFLSQIRNEAPHDMFVRNGMAMLGDGEIWFDAKGAASINPGD